MLEPITTLIERTTALKRGAVRGKLGPTATLAGRAAAVKGARGRSGSRILEPTTTPTGSTMLEPILGPAATVTERTAAIKEARGGEGAGGRAYDNRSLERRAKTAGESGALP